MQSRLDNQSTRKKFKRIKTHEFSYAVKGEKKLLGSNLQIGVKHTHLFIWPSSLGNLSSNVGNVF